MTAESPIKKNKNDDFLNPSSVVGLVSIKYPVIMGTIHYDKLDTIYMMPMAVPKTFFFTTIGIAATITLA
jgi:hypothetical protein